MHYFNQNTLVRVYEKVYNLAKKIVGQELFSKPEYFGFFLTKFSLKNLQRKVLVSRSGEMRELAALSPVR